MILITTVQASKLLGVKAPSTIGLLVKKGFLKDYGSTKLGHQRHVYQLDLEEVKDYADKVKNDKLEKKQQELDLKAARVERKLKRVNGLGVDNVMTPKIDAIPVPAIVNRLERIEAKLDLLIEAFK